MRRFASLVGVVLLSAMVVAVCGCGGGAGPGEAGTAVAPAAAPPTAPYFPLAVGNTWNMKTTYYANPAAGLSLPDFPLPAGAAGSLSSNATSTSGFKITGTKTFGGAKWFVGGYTPPLPSMEPWYGRHATAGMWVQNTNAGTPYYLLKAPIKVGTKWSMAPAVPAKRKITKLGATTTVAAGTFKQCMVIQQTYTSAALKDLVVTYWFAPGTGVVRTEIRDAGVLTTKIELVKATLK